MGYQPKLLRISYFDLKNKTISKTRLLSCSSDETADPESTNSIFFPTKINLLIFKENSFEEIIAKGKFREKKNQNS